MGGFLQYGQAEARKSSEKYHISGAVELLFMEKDCAIIKNGLIAKKNESHPILR